MNSKTNKAASAGRMPRLVRHLDLFSGIGGFALAAQMVGGIQTVAFCEIDEKPRRVLQKNFPGVPIHHDVKTLDPNQYGTIDLITGGYPCQPFSLAGERRGAEDDRHLWPQVLRIVAAARPRWMLCENVAGHVTMGLDAVLSELESIGYTGRAIVVPACAVDARHRRDRVWIMAHSDHGLRRQDDGGMGGSKGESRSEAQGWPLQERVRDAWNDGSPAGGKTLANANMPRRQEQRRTLANGTQHEAAKCGGWWGAEPRVGRMAHGLPGRVDRLKGLGNAIVPQVAAEILRCMMRADSSLLNGRCAPTGVIERMLK